jgi:hypothetical protein
MACRVLQESGMRALSVAMALALAATGCVETLAPPASPEPTLSGDVPPPGRGPEGFGRVTLSTDVPARVERLARIDGVRHTGVSATLLCARTPCEVTLPYGDYDLRFTSTAGSERSSGAVLSVHDTTVVLRHVLGQERSGGSAIGPVLLALGAATLVGAVVAAVALQQPPSNPSNGPSGPPPTGSSNPAPYLALGGVGILGAGAFFLAMPPTVHQDGATTQWSPPVASAPAIGGSVGVRF